MTRHDAAFANIDRLLAPRSVAVIGASDKPGNLGGDTVRRLVKFKFPGPVWPVNPSGATVADLPCFKTVADIPGTPDAVVICIQAAALPDALRECIAKGIRNGVAFAGGLAESGTPEGIELQRQIVEICKAGDFKLCGPNCVGIISTATPVTLTFATALHEVDNLRPGAISMVSQSGGIGTTSLSIALNAGFGFRALVSSGNECVVDFADYLHAFAQDDGTRVIAAYLEGIAGDSSKLVRALEEARKRSKPVVMIKSGASAASAKAALAHTGALAGEDRVFDAVLRETGTIRADSVEELLDISLVLAGIPAEKMPTGKGVGIITFGGGNGVLAADQCSKVGLDIPDLSAGCVAKLKTLLVSVASAANPMDLTPTTAFREDSLARLPQALDVLASEPSIHSLMFIVGSLASKAPEISDVIEAFWRRCPKPVCVVWPAPPIGILDRLAAAGIHAFVEPARGARALARMASLHDAPVPTTRPAPLAFDWDSHASAQHMPAVITEDRCHSILAAAGLSVAEGVLATSADMAAASFKTLGPSVALKGISPAVTHRAAAGLLALDLRSADAVADEFLRLQAKARDAGTALDGIYVQKMRGGGIELLVAAFRDPVFGLMVSVGAGGGLTELLDDVVIRRAPVDEAAAASMIDQLRVVRYARKGGRVPAGNDAATFVARFSRLAASAPWSRFTFEVNPIKWSPAGVVAVDGLLIVEAP